MGERLNAGTVCTRTVVFAEPGMNLVEAARLMRGEHVGSLVVVEPGDEGRVVVGMLTDRDIVTAVVAADVEARTLTVGDVMSGEPVTARACDSIADLLAKMRYKGVRRVPVVGPPGTLIGVVTQDDLLEVIADELQGLVRAMASERRHEERARA